MAGADDMDQPYVACIEIMNETTNSTFDYFRNIVVKLKCAAVAHDLLVTATKYLLVILQRTSLTKKCESHSSLHWSFNSSENHRQGIRTYLRVS